MLAESWATVVTRVLSCIARHEPLFGWSDPEGVVPKRKVLNQRGPCRVGTVSLNAGDVAVLVVSRCLRNKLIDLVPSRRIIAFNDPVCGQPTECLSFGPRIEPISLAREYDAFFVPAAVMQAQRINCIEDAHVAHTLCVATVFAHVVVSARDVVFVVDGGRSAKPIDIRNGCADLNILVRRRRGASSPRSYDGRKHKTCLQTQRKIYASLGHRLSIVIRVGEVRAINGELCRSSFLKPARAVLVVCTSTHARV